MSRPLTGLVLFGFALLVACGNRPVATAQAEEPSAASPGRSAERRESAGAPTDAAAEARDVLLITVDTLRADAVGFGGAPAGVTPVLDRLAAGGRVFADAHAHNVVTLPSHANILTGLLPYEHGIRDNAGFRLDESIPTLAAVLREAGFATAAVVGAFVLDARFGLDRGFDRYDDDLPEDSVAAGFRTVSRRGDEVVRRGLAWWREREGERRFLWLHLFDPHAPYAPPPQQATRFPGDPYRGEVAAVDAFLAPILEPLLAAADPTTLVVFTSDHGEALGEHGEMTHGLFAYEATLAVPLVVWGPGIESSVSAEPARHVDLMPTVLAATGVEAPPDLAGRSLLGAPPEAPPLTYFEALTPALSHGWAPLRGVIDRGFKLISLPLPELYDLARDPAEADNLFAAQRDRARRLAARLPEESSWPPERGEVSGETERSLRSLGYLGGDARRRTSWGPEDDPKRLVHLDRKMHRVIDHFERGELEPAIGLARQVVAERPDMAIASYYLAQFLLEKGALGEALEVMEGAYRRGATTGALERQLGLSLAEVGRTAEALQVLGPLAESGDPDALNALGLILSEAGRQEEARAALERVFERDPRNATARQHLALVAMRQGRWSVARDQAERALDLSPSLDQAWSYLGASLYQLGEKERAVDSWRRAVELEPRNWDALYNLSFVALEIGERQVARGALERFVSGAPPARYGPDLERARAALRSLGGS